MKFSNIARTRAAATERLRDSVKPSSGKYTARCAAAMNAGDTPSASRPKTTASCSLHGVGGHRGWWANQQANSFQDGRVRIGMAAGQNVRTATTRHVRPQLPLCCACTQSVRTKPHRYTVLPTRRDDHAHTPRGPSPAVSHAARAS
eukprot:SAG11_NODE_92_length_17132_cov_10.277285_9_plen_146_part_00